MIQISKPLAPEILLTKGKAETDKNFLGYKLGADSFNFDSNIYGHPSVKKLLEKAQHQKCCFCETKPIRSFGDVEHFRPKAAYRVAQNKPLIKPAYFWLAYDWENLFFACEVCNRSFKSSNFPIEDETTRAFSNGLNIEKEVSLLINPATDKPEEHIKYRGHQPIGLTPKGKLTIDYLGLKSNATFHAKEFLERIKKLENARFKYYEMVKDIFEISKLESKNIRIEKQKQKAVQKLITLSQPEAQWSLMIKCAIKDNFKY